MWKLDHVVPASDVDAEEQRLADVLSKAGYDVRKLSLNALAQQVLAERAKAVVMAIGIQPSNWPHYPLGNGGVEVRFQFSREEDQVNAKLALAEAYGRGTIVRPSGRPIADLSRQSAALHLGRALRLSRADGSQRHA